MSDLELSVSSASRDRGCERATAFTFRAGLRRKGKSIPLAIGSAFHIYAARHYSGCDEETAQKEALEDFYDNIPDDVDPEKEEKLRILLLISVSSILLLLFLTTLTISSQFSVWRIPSEFPSGKVTSLDA